MEAALVDHSTVKIAALDPSDERTTSVEAAVTLDGLRRGAVDEAEVAALCVSFTDRIRPAKA